MNKALDCIAILGGNVVRHGEKWTTTSFIEGDNFGALGDGLRAVAGRLLYEEKPEKVILVLGGRGQLEAIKDCPAISEVIRDELMQEGVPAERIICETESGNTWQQLQSLKHMYFLRKFLNMQVVSNRYHMPRLHAMIERDDELHELFEKKILFLVSAEDVIIGRKPEWNDMITAAYETAAIKERIRSEHEGVRQIRAGTYQFR